MTSLTPSTANLFKGVGEFYVKAMGYALSNLPMNDEVLTCDLEVVFIQDTAACKCYGCNGAVQSKPSEDPPAARYDIFL